MSEIPCQESEIPDFKIFWGAHKNTDADADERSRSHEFAETTRSETEMHSARIEHAKQQWKR